MTRAKINHHHKPTTRKSKMHLSAVHSGSYYSVRAVNTMAVAPLLSTLVRRSGEKSDLVNIALIVGGITVGAIVLGLIIRCLRAVSIAHAKRNGTYEVKKAQRWYGH
jgi:hypothetical protein